MTATNGRSNAGGLKRRIRTAAFLLGTLRKVHPVNPGFGLGEGTPVDRYYMARFLGSRSDAITGRVLEIGDREYTERFGHEVTSSDVLHFEAGSPIATIVADLGDCPQIASESFDCIILTQTLHYVFDMRAAVRELHRILAPGGRVLCTVPCISQISRHDMERWGDRWRLTTLGAAELFATAFPDSGIEVLAYGNTLAAVSLLEGIPAEKLSAHELDARDQDYEVIVAIDATKPAR